VRRLINTSQGADPVYPLRVYQIPLTTANVPQTAVSDFLDFAGVKTWSFVKDFSGTTTPFSPKDGSL